MESVSVCACL
uniref:Uncharacterized protein n=1 Tax=Anguilla anguilla TaxID=7936 RepID=A0A0E9XPG7_ANGAN